MREPRPDATGGRRPRSAAAKASVRAKTAVRKPVAKKPAVKKPVVKKPAARNGALPAPAQLSAQKRAERARVRAALPPLDPHYVDVWERGTATAYAGRAAAAVRVSLRSAHKRRLAAIETRTGLDRQEILNRAVATAWERLAMSGATLDREAARLRKKPSPADGTVSLYPTAATLRIFRQADHPHAKAILLQSGLDLWT